LLGCLVWFGLVGGFNVALSACPRIVCFVPDLSTSPF
jgi:hypothetical protein